MQVAVPQIVLLAGEKPVTSFPIMNLIDKVKKIIEKEKLIEEGDRVLLGASGGIDSTTLLFVLLEIRNKLPFELGIAHVNHLLRGIESDRDEDFTKTLADRYSIPCYIKKIDVKKHAKKSGMSIQHAGRDVRYGFFEEIARTKNYNKIAIAHHLDDQVETFLLRMLKGTGIRGLSSIPLKRNNIVRPFLHIYRSEIEEYAKTHSIPFVEDSSNEKVVYERNFIRIYITPLMEELNPAFREKIFLLLQDLTSINDLFEKKAEEFMKKEAWFEEGDIHLKVEALKNTDEETRFRVIAHLLAQIAPAFIPLREHLHLIEKIIMGSKPNLSVILPRSIMAKKVYDELIFTQKPSIPVIKDILPVKAGKNILKPFGLSLEVSQSHDKRVEFQSDRNVAFFDKDKTGSLYVRTFLEGDRFFPLGMKDSIKLKDFFISQKIPKEKRRHIPLLISGRDIIWIIGYRIDERHKVAEDTRNILKIVARTYQ